MKSIHKNKRHHLKDDSSQWPQCVFCLGKQSTTHETPLVVLCGLFRVSVHMRYAYFPDLCVRFFRFWSFWAGQMKIILHVVDTFRSTAKMLSFRLDLLTWRSEKSEWASHFGKRKEKKQRDISQDAISWATKATYQIQLICTISRWQTEKRNNHIVASWISQRILATDWGFYMAGIWPALG